MLFLLIAGTLTLIAFLFVLPPLWRQRPVAVADMDEHNTLIAKQRLAELKQQLQSGALNQQQYDEQLAELEQALSDDLNIDSQATPSVSKNRWMIFVLVAAIPLLTGSLYATLGNYKAINPDAEMLGTNPAGTSLEEVNKMVAKLAERMKTRPEDVEGWVMLGKSYKYLQQYPQALDAFEHAYKLSNNQVEILLHYADALASANNQQMTGKPAELVFKALTLEPDNLVGLWLGGMAKAQAGDALNALKLWQKLEALLPPGSPEQKQVQDLLAKLNSQALQTTSEQQAAQETNAAAIVSIDVEVSLASELLKSTNPGDTVFIYAQALSGPKMPLAIIRKHVADLPLKVSLDDTMAMMPTMKLSSFPAVKLLARVSKSGNAMPQAGDFIGSIDQVNITDKNNHKIVINNTIK